MRKMKDKIYRQKYSSTIWKVKSTHITNKEKRIILEKDDGFLWNMSPSEFKRNFKEIKNV